MVQAFSFFTEHYYYTEQFFPLPLVASVLDLFIGQPFDIFSSLYNLSVTVCATGVNGLLIVTVCISKSFFFCLPLTFSCSLLPPLFC